MPWFKNLKLFRLSPHAPVDLESLEQALHAYRFQAGGSQDPQVSGWAPAAGDERLAAVQQGQIRLRMRTEKKLLPASVIRQATQARALEIEENQGYRPGRKQMRELKDQITLELLPRAFSIHQDTAIWMDTQHGWVAVDTASTARSDDVMGLLADTLIPFPIAPLHTRIAPATAMTDWLLAGEAPAGFVIDPEAELRATGDSRASIRYVHQPVEAEEVRRHVEAGKQCTRLALTWNDRISFLLSDSLDLRRLTPLDILLEHEEIAEATDEAERLEAEFALMTGELSQLLTDLVAALGGERGPD